MKFCFHPSVSFEGGETVARMQREPRDSRARVALQLGRFCSVTSRRRSRNLRQRAGGTLRMFTQGKATEEYAVVAGAEATSAARVRCTAPSHDLGTASSPVPQCHKSPAAASL